MSQSEVERKRATLFRRFLTRTQDAPFFFFWWSPWPTTGLAGRAPARISDSQFSFFLLLGSLPSLYFLSKCLLYDGRLGIPKALRITFRFFPLFLVRPSVRYMPFLTLGNCAVLSPFSALFLPFPLPPDLSPISNLAALFSLSPGTWT